MSEWTRPITDAQPCGPNLEYDNEYVVLLARLTPQVEVQYGNFHNKTDAPDWSEIERECRRLLQRSKDIALLICLCRCRARLAGPVAFAQALGGLLEVLQTYPDAVHPQLEVDGQLDPEVRANALASLVDPEGLLADVRDMEIAAIATQRLTVKDFERSMAVPRPADALAPEAVQQFLAACSEKDDAPLRALAAAAQAAEQLDAWAKTVLDDAGPNLRPLGKLLRGCVPQVPKAMPVEAVAMPLAPPSEEQTTPSTLVQAAPLVAMPVASAPALPAMPALSSAAGREQARQTLKSVRLWFETQEPSSPVAVLLRQAERMIGMRYSELAQAIPVEILVKWEQQDAG